MLESVRDYVHYSAEFVASGGIDASETAIYFLRNQDFLSDD